MESIELSIISFEEIKWLLGKINIYVNNNLPYYNTIEYKSDIQLNTSSNLSYERFAII